MAYFHIDIIQNPQNVSLNKRANLSVPKTVGFETLSVDAKLLKEVSHDERIAV
jgi:hypothetical protein